MWSRSQLQRLINTQKALKAFYSSTGSVPKPSLNYPAGSDKIGVFGYLMLTIPVVTFGLGTWQVRRLEWKTNLVKELLEKTKSEPQPLPDDESELAALELRPVHVRGSYDHGRELYIGPRSKIVQTGEEELGRSGLLSTGQTGVQVVTPFRLADSGREILVNRGWVPTKKMAPSTRAEGQIVGEHEIVGVVRVTETRSQFMPADAATNKNMFLYRDLDRLSAVAGTSRVFLDLTADSAVPGSPLAGQTRVTLRNEHLQYAITWYLLSAATAVMWVRRFVTLPLIRHDALRKLR